MQPHKPFDRLLRVLVAIAQWLVLAIALLLLLQWPLRELAQRYSREANDLGQALFAIYVAVALSCASARDAHLATDVLAHRYSESTRRKLARAAIVVALIPWSLFVLATGFEPMRQSLLLLERFPDTFNPGYFVIKLAAWLLALLLLLYGFGRLARDRGR